MESTPLPPITVLYFVVFGAFFCLRTVQKKMEKPREPLTPCALFCRFWGSEASIHCIKTESWKKKAKNWKHPKKKTQHAWSPNPFASLHCSNPHIYGREAIGKHPHTFYLYCNWIPGVLSFQGGSFRGGVCLHGDLHESCSWRQIFKCEWFGWTVKGEEGKGSTGSWVRAQRLEGRFWLYSND